MNKKILFACVASGLIVGVLAASLSSPTVSHEMQSDTKLLVKADKKMNLVELNSSINLKRSGLFDMYFLTKQGFGFNSAGHYQFNRHGLSLIPESSEQVLPTPEDASLLEMMFSQRGMHSMEELKIIPVSEQQMVIVAPKYSYLFTKKSD
ncbi:hypothetical protein [Vibrio maerlii]|uniref:hypothetical protein n=1 Tax=Vibrio maerlii TaxID=2231648 RepID=UPI000E3DABF2|nr:hypothetical protein [Vibrio maerlii]